jgi:RHS repeat-associated protein
MDSLGRAFLVIAHNKVGAADEFHETRTKLDIEGQVLTVTDALGRVCQTNVYSMAGKILKDTNLDKGSRWNFHDVGGALIRRFDDRAQVFRLSYDALRRPTHLHLKPGAAAETLLQRTVYGDSAGTGITDPKVNNLRGKPIRLFDGAGRIKSESYDFKGSSLTSDRKLATAYTTTPDWTSLASITNVATLDSTAASLLESETFTESREYDALGRVTKVTAPDNSQFIPTYNEASLLEKVDVKIRGAASATPFVANIDYDAKGQRTAIIYSAGNFRTDYSYDPLTLRLTRVLTTRISPSETLQDLNYTFDPVGNIVEVTDAAQQSLLFTNGFATVPNKYEYDAVYRLKRGEGREHKSVGDVQVDHNDQAIWNLPHPNDPQAIRSYFETYAYDKIGNILEMFHNAGGGANTWTRTYNYGGGSPTNRLVSHNIPSGTATYSYDNHGSMTSMPHLSSMSWTPFDQMQSANKGGGGIVYFTYGADGQRVRKVWDKTASLREERIYLGGYEVYREKTSGVTQLERQTLHVMDGTKRLAMVETKTVSGGAAVTPLVSMFRYQLGNHLGSAVLEVDAAGLIISYEEYSPYGSSAYRSSRSGVDVSARRYRYVGLERDSETGLDSMGARYYAAWLGRWTSADPLGVGADGPGIYNYTRGSPVVLTDPGGMEVPERSAVASIFGDNIAATVAAIAEVNREADARRSKEDVSGGEALIGAAGLLGIIGNAVLPDAAREAVGGAARKQNERTFAPLALAEMLFVPATNAQGAQAKSDAILAMAPSIWNPGIGIGDSAKQNYKAASSSESVGGTAYGIYGLFTDAVDIASVFVGGGGPKGGGPVPKGGGPVPKGGGPVPKGGGPYRSPVGNGEGGGGGPTGGGPSGGGTGPTGGGAGSPDLIGLLKARLRQQAGFTSEGTPLIVDTSLGVNSTTVAQSLRDAGFNARSIVEIFNRTKVGDPDIRLVSEAIDGRVVASDKGRDALKPSGGGFPDRIKVPQRAGVEDAVRLVKDWFSRKQ